MPKKLLLIFIVAVLLRALFFGAAAARSDGSFSSEIPRYDGYYEIAENLRAGNGFSRSVAGPILPDSVRTPLYPLLLAAVAGVTGSYTFAIALQILISSAIPLIAYRLTRQIFPSFAWLATTGAIALVAEPLSLHLASTLQAETLFTALFLAGCTFLLDYWKETRIRPLVLAALLFGLATLARPTIQFFPYILAVVIFYLSRGRLGQAVSHSLIAGMLFFLVLAPWLARNVVEFGVAELNVQSASVPFGYLVPSMIALEEGLSFDEAQQKHYASEGGIESVEDITFENAAHYKARTQDLLLEHPVGLIKMAALTTVTFFTHDGYLDIMNRLGASTDLRLPASAITMLITSPTLLFSTLLPLLGSPLLLVFFGRIFWIAAAILALIGIVQFLRTPQQRPLGIFLLCIVCYFVLTTLAVGLAVNARFRFPVNAIVLMFAVYGAYECARLAKTIAPRNKG